jgi:hypothetical protein
MHDRALRLALLLSLAARGGAGIEPELADIAAVAPVRHGLVVHVGATDARFAIDYAAAHPVLVHAITADEAGAGRLRETVAKAGFGGQVSVSPLAEGRIPLVARSARLVVIDAERGLGLSADEAERVLSPEGYLAVKKGTAWTARQVARPATLGDWGQYHHDGAGSNTSTDQEVGPVRGLQWSLSTPEMRANNFWLGYRIVGNILVNQSAQGGIEARDAFSGLPVWRRGDIALWNRFAYLMDDERVYVLLQGHRGQWPARYLQAIDRFTGANVREYDQGIDFLRNAAPNGQGVPQAKASPLSRDIDVRLSEGGLLVMLDHDQLVVVDAKSGKRLWAQASPPGMTWCHPSVFEGQVVVAAGQTARSMSYTHWPATTVEQVMSFALDTGAIRWTYQRPADRPPFVSYNIHGTAKGIAMACRSHSIKAR